MSNENIEKSSRGKSSKKSWWDIPYKRVIELTIALVTLTTIATQLVTDNDPIWTPIVESLRNDQEYYLHFLGILFFMLTSYATILFIVDWHLPTTLFLKFIRYIIHSISGHKIGIVIAIIAGFYASNWYSNEDNVANGTYENWAYWGIPVALAVLTVYHFFIPWIKKSTMMRGLIDMFKEGLNKHKEEPIYNFMALLCVVFSFRVSKFVLDVLDNWDGLNIGENYIVFIYILLFVFLGFMMFFISFWLIILYKFIFEKTKEMWSNRKNKKS